MLLSTEPPAPIAVRRPGVSSPLAGGMANSASTIRVAGCFFVQPAGAVSVSFPSPMVNVRSPAGLSWREQQQRVQIERQKQRQMQRAVRMAMSPECGVMSADGKPRSCRLPSSF